MRRALPRAALAAALALAAADAGAAPQRPPQDYDGTLLDRYSRLIFRFNTGAYWALDAAARRLGLPSPAPEGRQGEAAAPRADLGNVASNLVNEPVTALSGLLTGDMATAWRATQRFAINASVGVLGWYDRAAEWGLEPVHADIGLALCRAGVGEGGYIMLPFVGPRTVRDAIADILSATLYITDVAQKPALNKVWKEWLSAAHLPARAGIGVADLGPGVLVEVMVTGAT
ncbi:MAG: VacJ family lipoprotein [Alphaproteobacteria bacterium]|nr:VacJ family lipoprotein [Alphaproteobacteria bacterium]